MKKHNYSLIIGLILTGIILIITIIGQFWTPYDITGMNSMARNQAPSLMHIMGTDNFGRDVFSRVMNGCGTTFFVALSTVVIGCFFGVIIGALTGFYGGLVDEIVMRINDVLLSFPSVLLVLIFISFIILISFLTFLKYFYIIIFIIFVIIIIIFKIISCINFIF